MRRLDTLLDPFAELRREIAERAERLTNPKGHPERN